HILPRRRVFLCVLNLEYHAIMCRPRCAELSFQEWNTARGFYSALERCDCFLDIAAPLAAGRHSEGDGGLARSKIASALEQRLHSQGKDMYRIVLGNQRRCLMTITSNFGW